MDEQEVMTLTGREMDAAVAERVMGWSWWAWAKVPDGMLHRGLLPSDALSHPAYWHGRPATNERLWSNWDDRLPAYSSTWEGMGLVVEEMERRGWAFSVARDYTGGHLAMFGRMPEGPIVEKRGITAPEAVCRAALLALGKGE